MRPCRVPFTPLDPASGVAALRAAIDADFGGEVGWRFGEWQGVLVRGPGISRARTPPHAPLNLFSPPPLPALTGATFAHAAGAVCTTPPAWGWAPDDIGTVVLNLVPPGPDPAPALASLGLLPPGTPALPPWATPPPPPVAGPDGAPLPPVAGLEPLIAAFTCPASGRAWLVRRRARRTLGDALRFGGRASPDGSFTPFFSPPAARLLLFQVAAAVRAAQDAGLPPPLITPDDVLLGDGCARAAVAPAALLRGWGSSSLLPPPLPPWEGGGLADATAAWVAGHLRTLPYLLRLQALAGRRWGDPRAHPFLPWVLADPGQEPDLSSSSPAAWARDLTRTQWRLVKGDAQLDASFEAAASPGDAHHVPSASPLGELGFCVALARSLPRALLTQHVRRGWQPGEYPPSLARLAAWTADEAVPELYCGDGAAVFRSTHADLADLALPAWAPDPAAFTSTHAAALESGAVAAALPAWLDLTFGVSLSGPAAVVAKNTAPPREVRAGLPGVGRCQLFAEPHPARAAAAAAATTTADDDEPADPIPAWDDGLIASAGPGGAACLGRLAVLTLAGRLSPLLAPWDAVAWAAAASALGDAEVATFASACLAGTIDDALFPPAVRAASAALLQQADAEAAARCAGAGAGVAAAAGLAAAAGGRGSALASAPPESWTLVMPSLLAALGRAFAGSVHSGCSSTDTAGANAAAAALGVLLGRAPWGALIADAIPHIGRLLASGSAAVAAGSGQGVMAPPSPADDSASTSTPAPPRNRAPTMLSALLSRPCMGALLSAAGPAPYLACVHAAALDCLILAGTECGGGGGGNDAPSSSSPTVAAAAADAMGEAAACLPLPAALEWVARPLVLALAAPGRAPVQAAAGLVAVGRAVGAAAVARHLLPPLVSIIAARTPRGGWGGGQTPSPPSAAAVAALEGLIPLLARPGAAGLVAPRPLPDGRLAPARAVGPLLEPAAYAPLDSHSRVQLARALVAAADVSGEGGAPSAFARDLLPQLLPLFRVLPGPSGREAYGAGEDAEEAMPPSAAADGPSTDLAARLAEAMGGLGGGAARPLASSSPPPGEAGWWRLVAALYPASVARSSAPVVRTLVPGWVGLEAGVASRAVPAWTPPPADPPSPSDTASVADLARSADRFLPAGRTRRATVEEAPPASAPVAPLDEDAAARAAALISGAGWSHPAPSERTGQAAAGPPPPPAEAATGRWEWLPPGLAPPPGPLDKGGWGSPALWAGPPPRSAAALLGGGGVAGTAASSSQPSPPSARIAPPPWAVQARPLHAWRAHRDRLSGVAVDDGERLVVTAGKAGPRRGGEAGSAPPAPPPPPSGRDTARIWSLADGRAGGEYGGHGARITGLALSSGPAPAVASLDEGGALHVWAAGDPARPPWIVGGRGPGGVPALVVVEATGTPPPALKPAPAYTCVVRSGDGGLDGAAFVAGTADGRVVWLDAGAQEEGGATRALPGSRAAAAVTALHAPASLPWTVTGTADGWVGLVDGRCAAPVAAWSGHPGGVGGVTAVLGGEGTTAVVTAGVDRVVRAWDVRAVGSSSSSPPPLLHAWAPLKAAPTGLAPAPGGSALLHAGPALAALPPLGSAPSGWAPALATLRAAPPRTAVAGLALLPWSRLLVIGCDDGHVLVCK